MTETEILKEENARLRDYLDKSVATHVKTNTIVCTMAQTLDTLVEQGGNPSILACSQSLRQLSLLLCNAVGLLEVIPEGRT